MEEYEIGIYGFDLNKRVIWYKEVLDGTYNSMQEAWETIRQNFQEENQSGEQKRLRDEGEVNLYFVSKLPSDEKPYFTITLHASGTLDEEALEKLREYDDRIVVLMNKGTKLVI